MPLRLANNTDIEFLHRLYMHTANNRWLLYEQMDSESFRPVADELIRAGALYIFETGGSSAGMCKLLPQRFRNSHILYLGGLAIEPEFSGQGLGKLLLEDIIRHATDRGVHRIELTVSVENSRAIKLYLNAGFQQEGRLRDFTWLAAEGRYMDEYIMSYLLNERPVGGAENPIFKT